MDSHLAVGRFSGARKIFAVTVPALPVVETGIRQRKIR